MAQRRQYKTGRNNRTTYIYYDAYGRKVVEMIPGENGVTSMDIEILHENDDAMFIATILQAEETNNTYDYFESHIANFIAANQTCLDYLIDEAHRFIKRAAERFDQEHIVVSFFGVKDSTVIADVVTKALSSPELNRIFGNTTLEFSYILVPKG